MAKVKIYIESGESERDVEEALVKAITTHSSGELHQDGFEDLAMNSVVKDLEDLHREMYIEMIQEICEQLDLEYGEKW